jgi:hypothetical protein
MKIQSLLVAGVTEHIRRFIAIVSKKVFVCRPEIIAQMIVKFVLEEFGFFVFHFHRNICILYA